MLSILRAAILAILVLAPSAAAAQAYPARRVTIVVPFAAGSASDVYGRFLAEGLSKRWKQTVVVDNRPGAGAAIGTVHAARSRPDGYTLLLTSSTYTILPAALPTPPYDPVRDLEPVAMLGTAQMVMLTGSRVPLPTFREVIRRAKTERIFCGTTGAGSTGHFLAELVNKVAGVKMIPVHYLSSSTVLMDLGGGRLDTFIASTTSALPSIQSGKGRPVAILSKTRSRWLPSVPTARELGYAGLEVDPWWGVMVPVGVPADITARLNRDVNAVMSTPDAARFLEKSKAVPARMTNAEFRAHISNEYRRWQEVAPRSATTRR